MHGSRVRRVTRQAAFVAIAIAILATMPGARVARAQQSESVRQAPDEPKPAGERFAITRRYVPHVLNFDDQQSESAWGAVERRVAFDPKLCALVVVDTWNTNEISFERIDRIVRERIEPVVAVCRDAGFLIVHAPGPPVADKYPAFRFRSPPGGGAAPAPAPGSLPAPARPAAQWPTAEMLARTGAFAQHSLRIKAEMPAAALSEEELYRNYLIHPSIVPHGQDLVVADQAELHDALRDRRRFHLFYVGFAANGCIQERDYGIKLMNGRGYDVTLLRDCTTATEMAHTLGTLEQTRASIENMEFWISTADSLQLRRALAPAAKDGRDRAAQRAERRIRKRRVILNDDGEPMLHEKSPATFLAKRFRQANGTQVDTYLYHVGDGWHPHRGRKPDPGLGDPNRVIVEAAHHHRMEIFASLRMNDIHCSFDGTLSALQRERPELLLGGAFAPDKYPHLFPGEQGRSLGGYPLGLLNAFWAGMNFAFPEVRELRRARVEEIAREYDFDGIELDFFRHPLFFKPGEERENLAAMTDLVRQIRRTLDRIGEQRGRPYLLAVRVPDTLAICRRTGLDLTAWLEAGFIDLLMVGGGYMPYASRIKELIDLAHLHGIPAYPLVDIDNWYSAEEKLFKGAGAHATVFDSYCEPDKVRAIASNFWALGGDGVYLFNWYGLADAATEQLALLDQVGDVERLRYLSKRFQPDNGCDDWQDYCGYATAPRQFPIRLIDGTPVQLVIGDDLPKAASAGKVAELQLRIEVAQLRADEEIDLTINGLVVPESVIKRADAGAFQANLLASSLRQGINEIVVAPGKGSIGRLSSRVNWIELSVRYR